MPHPEEIPVAGIKPCSKPDCVALAYAPAPSKAFTPSEGKIMDSEFPVDMPAARREELQRVHAIIKSAMINNRGGALKPSMVKGFTTTRDMEEFILQNANNVKAGRAGWGDGGTEGGTEQGEREEIGNRCPGLLYLAMPWPENPFATHSQHVPFRRCNG